MGNEKLVSKFEVVIEIEPKDSGEVSEHVLFTVTNSQSRAQTLADSVGFLVGKTVTEIFVRRNDQSS